MAIVDVEDESIKRFALFHHRFDAQTNHFRWFPVIAFDDYDEFEKYFVEVSEKLELEKKLGRAKDKEQFAGRKIESNSTTV